jgi:hypothetical protein
VHCCREVGQAIAEPEQGPVDVIAAAPADQPTGRAAAPLPTVLRPDTVPDELVALRHSSRSAGQREGGPGRGRATDRAVGGSVPSEFLNVARALLAAVLET